MEFSPACGRDIFQQGKPSSAGTEHWSPASSRRRLRAAGQEAPSRQRFWTPRPAWPNGFRSPRHIRSLPARTPRTLPDSSARRNPSGRSSPRASIVHSGIRTAQVVDNHHPGASVFIVGLHDRIPFPDQRLQIRALIIRRYNNRQTITHLLLLISPGSEREHLTDRSA